MWTLWEYKHAEWRVLLYRGKVFKAMQKQPYDKNTDQVLKQDNCHYEEMQLENPVAVEVCQRAANALGIDVCGIDLAITSRGPVVIEVNSAPGLGYDSLKKLKALMEKDFGGCVNVEVA